MLDAGLAMIDRRCEEAREGYHKGGIDKGLEVKKRSFSWTFNGQGDCSGRDLGTLVDLTSLRDRERINGEHFDVVALYRI